MRDKRVVVLGFVAAAILVAILVMSGTRGRRPNILLISVDTLRPDHLSLYGYHRDTSPSLVKFFADAEIYDRAYATHACTPPSTVSLLSGLYPASHGVRNFSRPLRSEIALLPDHLRVAGYQTAAVVSNYVLRDGAVGLGSHFDTYDDLTNEQQPTRKGFYERRGSRTTDAALQWMTSQRDPQRPHLLWVHYMDPHSPYIPPEKVADFSHAEPIEIELDRVRWHARLPGVTDGDEYVDRYDEEIAYTDAHIGRLLAEYEGLGLLENSIVVLTADHGETMIEHDRYFAHCFNVWEPVMRIPLAVRWPGRAARRSQVPVSIVDVTPSLLAYVGLRAPTDLDGKRFAERTDTDWILLEGDFEKTYKGHTRGIVQGTSKWGVLVRRGKIARRWFFDLDVDPDELGDDAWRIGRPGAALVASVARAPGEQPPSKPLDERTDLTARDLEALRGLGYLE